MTGYSFGSLTPTSLWNHVKWSILGIFQQKYRTNHNLSYTNSITAGTIFPGTIPVSALNPDVVTGHIVFQGVGKDIIDVEDINCQQRLR